jgi:hypothetical protein
MTLNVMGKVIRRCYHECPHFSLDGGPSSVMYCVDPSFAGRGYDAFIISHPECDEGFPRKCPLLFVNQTDGYKS